MAYMCNLGNGQQVVVENQDNQTIVTLSGRGPGQQQQASTGFSTGKWTALPVLYREGGGFILRLETDRGPHYVQLQGSSMSAIGTTPHLGNAEVMPLQTLDRPQGGTMNPMEPMQPMKPMQPMNPMEPMKMGDMEMRMNPMEMRMGKMNMSMGDSSPSYRQNFCSQCGAPVKENDRFCANCGNRLA
jgi:hypothetical protein